MSMMRMEISQFTDLITNNETYTFCIFRSEKHRRMADLLY